MLIKNKPISKFNRQLIAVGSIVICLLLFVIAWIKDSSEWYLSVGIVGIPLLLLSASLLFGEAKKGRGIISSTTLYFLGAVITLALIIAKFNGETFNPIITVIPFAIFALASTRNRKK